jgi:hypothetical protein
MANMRFALIACRSFDLQIYSGRNRLPSKLLNSLALLMENDHEMDSRLDLRSGYRICLAR